MGCFLLGYAILDRDNHALTGAANGFGIDVFIVALMFEWANNFTIH